MPLYEYRCTSCKSMFEVIQKFSDRPLRKCKECSGKLEKIISRSSFMLKGEGWYADNYGKGSSTRNSTKETSSSSKKKKKKKDSSSDGSSGTKGGSSGSGTRTPSR